METKTQIVTNIALMLCFAFAVYINLETHKKIQKMQSLFELIELRDQMYVEQRTQFLKRLEEELDNAKIEVTIEE